MTFHSSDQNGWPYNDLDELPELPVDQLTRDSLWTTRDGKKIAVHTMDDNHLLNTIRVLRGKSPIGTKFVTDSVRRRDWLNVMANEAYHRNLAIDEVDEKDPVHE